MEKTDKQKMLEKFDNDAQSVLQKIFERQVQFDISIRELSEKEIETITGGGNTGLSIGNHIFLFDDSLPF